MWSQAACAVSNTRQNIPEALYSTSLTNRADKRGEISEIVF